MTNVEKILDKLETHKYAEIIILSLSEKNTMYQIANLTNCSNPTIRRRCITLNKLNIMKKFGENKPCEINFDLIVEYFYIYLLRICQKSRLNYQEEENAILNIPINNNKNKYIKLNLVYFLRDNNLKEDKKEIKASNIEHNELLKLRGDFKKSIIENKFIRDSIKYLLETNNYDSIIEGYEKLFYYLQTTSIKEIIYYSETLNDDYNNYYYHQNQKIQNKIKKIIENSKKNEIKKNKLDRRVDELEELNDEVKVILILKKIISIYTKIPKENLHQIFMRNYLQDEIKKNLTGKISIDTLDKLNKKN